MLRQRPAVKQFQLWLLLLIVPALTGNGPVETYTLDRLLTNARATSPVMEIARAKLSKFEAMFDRAYYAWSPVLKVDALMAPLPERRILNRCVDPTVVDPMTGFAQVIPCPGQNLQQDERNTADTDIGLLIRTGVEVTFPIYTFGKIAHGQEAARAGIDVGRSGVDYARSELEFLVKKAYYGAQMADSALGVLKDGRKRMAKAKLLKNLQLIQAFYKRSTKITRDEELESRFSRQKRSAKRTGIRLLQMNDSTNVRLDTMVGSVTKKHANNTGIGLRRGRTYEWRVAVRARQSEVSNRQLLPDIARRRVSAVRRELPMTLDLFATML